jgi:predicted lipid-binding transport protein (Tim44 family)
LAAIDARADDSPCAAAQPAYPVGSLGGLFSRPGLIGGFAAGFLGAGVFGLLFGHGMIGELSSFPSMLGLLLQVALLLMLGRLIWTWWRADKAAAMAKLSPRQLADAYGRMRNEGVSDVNADDLAAVSEEKEIFANRKR